MTTKKSSWPKQSATVISDSPNVHMLLRELLRSYNWTVVDSTDSADKAINSLRLGQAFLMIIDDSLRMPAVSQIRYMLTDPLSVVTPTLSFLLEAHKGETNAIAKLGNIQVVEKPLTPSKFIPGFIQLVRNWEKEPFVSLRQASYHFLTGNDRKGLQSLLKLTSNDLCRVVCSQTLALHLRQRGKIKEAETLLLTVLKKSPRDLGSIIALADLYIHASMPKLAYRLLSGAKNAFGQSLAMLPDLIQAAILTGDINQAIGHLYTLQKNGFLEDEVQWILARLLFAEGRESEAEKVLHNNKNTFKKLKDGWDLAEAASPPAAAS